MSQTHYRQKGRIMRYRKTLRVGQTFLQQRKRQRDVHNKQLRAPVSAPDPMPTQVSSETQSVCLRPSLPSIVSHTHHRPLIMIPVLRPCKRVVRFLRLSRRSVSCYLRLQISGLHKNTISHCRTGLLITVLRLLDSNQT